MKLDLGFRIRLVLQAKGPLGIQAGKAIECVEDPKGEIEFNGYRYHLIEDNKPRTKLHTYGARVLKVIDGDTMWVEINCGFGVSIEEKLRRRRWPRGGT